MMDIFVESEKMGVTAKLSANREEIESNKRIYELILQEKEKLKAATLAAKTASSELKKLGVDTQPQFKTPTKLRIPSYFEETFNPYEISEFTIHKARVTTLENEPLFKGETLIFDKEFERIELPQKTQPPELVPELQTVVTTKSIFPLDAIKKIAGKRNNLDIFDKIPRTEEINFESIGFYTLPSEDKNFDIIRQSKDFKFASSTSSVSFILIQLIYKLTNFLPPFLYGLDEGFLYESSNFMFFQRKPCILKLIKRGDYFVLDKQSEYYDPEEVVLLKMGKYMEKMLTMQSDEFRVNHMDLNKKEFNYEPEFYKFARFDNILLRSQIDCKGKNAAGEDIVFEIKTRAASPIRYDVFNWRNYLNYEIKHAKGRAESFEREYYDLIRGAFMKYFIQLKIGGMEGAILAYHNIEKIAGFEYIKLDEMEQRLFGNSEFANKVFSASLASLQILLNRIVADFPNMNALYLGVYANASSDEITIFVEELDSKSYPNKDKLMRIDFIDYFFLSEYRPKVHEYRMRLKISLNGITNVQSPIYYDKGDNYEVEYDLAYCGIADFESYMKFLHEANMCRRANIGNEWIGSWN